MSQLSSSLLPSQPSQKRTLSGCTYIINKGRIGERGCTKIPKSGPLCAEHKLRKPQKREVEGEDDNNDGSSISGSFSRLGLSTPQTAECTPETHRPTHPSIEVSNFSLSLATDTSPSPRSARSKRSSPSATSTPARSRTALNISSSISSTDTSTIPEPIGTPTRSKRKPAAKTTTKQASSRRSSSSRLVADAPSPALTGISNDEIEEITDRLNDLNVLSSNGTEKHASRIEEISVENEDEIGISPPGREWPEMPKLKKIAPSEVSYGPRDAYTRNLRDYLMDGLDDTLVGDLIKRLPAFPSRTDGEGYVYIYLAIPIRSLPGTRDNNNNNHHNNKKRLSTTALIEGMKPEERMVVKVGHALDPKQRLKTLCNQFLYKCLEVFPKEKKVRFRHKAEQMAHEQLRYWRYRPEHGCLCNTEHKELYEVTREQLDSVFRCVDHWATVVNKHHEKLWPGAVEWTFQD